MLDDAMTVGKPRGIIEPRTELYTRATTPLYSNSETKGATPVNAGTRVPVPDAATRACVGNELYPGDYNA